MNYRKALDNLEKLRAIVDAYEPKKYTSEPETKELQRKLVEAYGSVEDLFERFVGRSEIRVSIRGDTDPTIYPNLFEAGYLSGRTTHAHQGYSQLQKVIGKVRAIADDPLYQTPKDEASLATLIRVLSRFRECCQYLVAPPKSERDVQDLVWIILRSHFDRLDREDTLPKFGVKNYRPDFGVPELRTLIEIKYVGEKTNLPSIQEELLADLPGYLADQSRYDGVVYFVYDAAQKLRDPRKFIDDMRSTAGVTDVIVIPGIG